MQFRRIRAVVLRAGLASAPLVACATGESSSQEYVVDVADDGRPCEEQCLEASTSTNAAWSRSPFVSSSVDDCSAEGGTVTCTIEVVFVGVGRPAHGVRLSGTRTGPVAGGAVHTPPSTPRGRGQKIARRSLSGPPQPGSLAHELARMAALEAASVQPFLALANALESLGAPRRLVRGARAAARDEVRHARAAAAWARRLGAARVAWSAPAAAWTDLVSLARDNRVHGLVGETWGAVLLAAQAEAAGSPGLRRFYGRIARDEARHSALARAVDRWARARLDATELRALDRAEAEALAHIEASVRSPGAPRDPMGGAPEGPRLATLWESARAELWS